jgi:glycosyltransferase involved in cell wall biosynthesis
MLIGMAREIRALGVPVVCSLSGEDVFLEKLPEPYYSQARKNLRERAAELDAFTALNGYYADYMAEYLSIPRSRIDVIPHGLKLEGHGKRLQRPAPVSTGLQELAIGYLARICPDKGTHLLIAAFELLQADPALPPLKLRIAGYLGASDHRYFEAIRERVAGWPAPERFEYVGEVTREQKIAFLQSLEIFSIPTVYPESKGLPVLEAWANALPIVLPAHGTFPELSEDTGGALLHAPDDPVELAAALKKLILDPELRTTLGQSGQAAVHDRYHAASMAERTASLYRRVLAKQSASPQVSV